jgi:hypothetical protein
MKIKLLVLIGLFVSNFSFAQSGIANPDESKKMGSSIPSQSISIRCMGFVNPISTDLKWRPMLTNLVNESEPLSPDQELIEKIKSEKFIQKQQQGAENRTSNQEPSTQFVNPVVGTNYAGNTNDNMSPLDNSVAISNGGYIVSVSNFSIEYDNMSGTNLYYNSLLTLVNGVDPGITGVCDPVIIYDSGSDRFICFVQSMPLTSNKIFVFFSQSNNPLTGWWIYELAGDPTGNGDGFDYPKLAVSTNELFITGNLFSEPSNTFHQAVIFQIDKLAGYSGASLNYIYYNNINGSPFTLLPVSYGQSGNYGPGIFLVSTNSAGGSTINLYQITNDMCCSPVINYWSVPTTPYSIAADANQLGTSCTLKTGDCRILSGFYLFNAGVGTIHFVFHSDIGSGWHGINYNRLVVNTLSNTSSTYGLIGSYDYCYPSVVSFASTPADNSVMIGFGRSGSSIHPEVRVVNCDNAMNWSGSTLVKSSLSYVSYTSSTAERWGDYTGTVRKHNSPTPSVWMNGMYGDQSNLWETWIAEIHASPTGIDNATTNSDILIYPNPVIDVFNIEFEIPTNENIEIAVYDMSGQVVKELYNGKAISGTNNFSFNKANLSAGTYFLTIRSSLNTIKNEKIIIAP